MYEKAHLTSDMVIEMMTKQGLHVDSPADQKTFLQQLCEKAKQFSYAPYSNFNVGAAALLKNGDIVLGANLELGRDLITAIHAEQSIIVQAMALEQEILKLAVNYAPCGFCRQSLMEFCNAGDIQIYFNDKQATLSKLLPLPFTPSDLGQTLLPPYFPKNNVETEIAWDSVPETIRWQLQANLAASYAPRTNSPAAVAVESVDGKVFYGRYFENVAFNPTISAIRFCFVMLAHYGINLDVLDTGYIINVWLVQSKDSTVDHLQQTRELLFAYAFTKPINIINAEINKETQTPVLTPSI